MFHKDTIYGLHSYQSIVDQELEAYYNDKEEDDGKSLIFDRSIDTKWLLMGESVEKVLFDSSDKYQVIKSNDYGICNLFVINKKSERIGATRFMNMTPYFGLYHRHLVLTAFWNKTNKHHPFSYNSWIFVVFFFSHI